MRTRNTDKEQRVKEKAIDLMVNEGLAAFSINRLAKECGISVATLYIYYRDKDDLIRQIGIELGQQFFTATFEDFSPDMPFAAGLRKQWENRARYTLAHPNRVAFYEIVRHSPYGEEVQGESFRAFGEGMRQFLQRALQNRELIPVSIEVFWSLAFAPLYTLLRFHQEGKSVGGRPFRFTQEAMDEAFALVIKALTP